jgi:predicted ABC-type ATPase
VPEVIIIAGPHGAGKTTFASEYLPKAQQQFEFVNADEIARNLVEGNSPQQQADMRAARAMLDRIETLAKAGADFALETTLATLTYARKIPLWRKVGYTVSLIYLRLPAVEVSIERVRRRVDAGGHSISEEIIRRRFDRSIISLEKVYKQLVDEWYVWDSREGAFVPLERWGQK